jgi:hypothetical protein
MAVIRSSRLFGGRLIHARNPLHAIPPATLAILVIDLNQRRSRRTSPFEVADNGMKVSVHSYAQFHQAVADTVAPFECASKALEFLMPSSSAS